MFIVKLLFVVVLFGSKRLIDIEEVNCNVGDFVFMVNIFKVVMCNIL